MVYQRQSGEPIDLRAALPVVGSVRPVDFDEMIRNRLRPIDRIGDQQSEYEFARNTARRESAYRQRLAELSAAAQRSRAQGMPMGNAGGGAVQLPNGKWLHPLGNGMRPTFGYGAEYRKGGTHHGYDFAVGKGTPVYAPNSGILNFAGWDKTGFGNALKIQMGNYLGILGHLSGFAPGIKSGMKVTPGMLLGYVGSTGRSTGNHLHYEMQDLGGKYFNFGNWYGW